jgi:hypothetical protein
MQGDLKLQTPQLGIDLTKAGAHVWLASRWQQVRLCGLLAVVLMLTPLGFAPVARAQGSAVSKPCAIQSYDQPLIVPGLFADEPLSYQVIYTNPFVLDRVTLTRTGSVLSITPYLTLQPWFGPPTLYCITTPIGVFSAGASTLRIDSYLRDTNGPIYTYFAPNDRLVTIGGARVSQMVPTLDSIGLFALVLLIALVIWRNSRGGGRYAWRLSYPLVF